SADTCRSACGAAAGHARSADATPDGPAAARYTGSDGAASGRPAAARYARSAGAAARGSAGTASGRPATAAILSSRRLTQPTLLLYFVIDCRKRIPITSTTTVNSTPA